MTPEQNHHLYRWTEYHRELQREENQRRHARAAILGGLTAFGLALIYFVVAA